MELNEFLTRKQKIDVMLKEQGWVVGDRSKIIVEVDTKQSDFRAQNYKTVSETLKNDRRIVDRSKSVECTKRVLEHINKGNRKALIVMATGTGKTRVAMAIIDVLMKANWAQKVLFLADRKALRRQACDDGFKQFFPEESKSMIHSGVFNRNSRLYVSTIQTFM